MTSPVNAPNALDRRTLGPVSLTAVAVSASAPMVVLAGGITATYAATGVVGVPLSFILLGGILALFAVGYGAMARRVASPAPFYAYLAQGVSRVWGVAGGILALVSYNAIQISLYGLFGATFGSLVGGDVPWFIWSGGAWLIVAFLGLRRVTLNAKLIATLLLLEVGIILIFDLGAFSEGAASGSLTAPMQPGSLLVSGIGGVLALGIAAFVGCELPAVYGEEASSGKAVSRAVLAAVGVICVLYTVSAWAVAVAAGPDRVVDAARDPESGIPFSLMAGQFGDAFSTIAQTLLVTSILGALVTFHHTVARYVYALARDGVLPSTLGRIGSGSGGGAPVNGSLLQTGVALVVVLGFVLTGADPVTGLFTMLSTLAAIGVMTLMVMVSVAAVRLLGRGQAGPSHAQRGRNGGVPHDASTGQVIFPALAAIGLLGVLVTTVVNLNSLVGSPVVAIALPAIVIAALVGGLIWGSALRTARPEVFGQVGNTQDNPFMALDHSLDQWPL
jgi:amino acid transporter